MSTTEAALAAPAETSESIYNRIFWLSFTANTSLVTANALTFRFAELVSYLGGTEETSGSIVGIGMIGAIMARLLLGQGIDHFGVKKVWPAMSILFVLSCFLFLVVTELTWMIYFARIIFAVGLAGMFTCSMVHIQQQVPAHRRTEVLGILGTSGFIGMVLGTQLGDAIFNTLPEGRTQFLALFSSATALGLFYILSVRLLTRRDNHNRPHQTHAAHRLIFRYWPGNVVFVAIMMGVSFTVISVFLTRFATTLGLSGIGTYFAAFSVFAFFTRVIGRGWSRTIGRHRLILMGLGGQCLGFVLFPFVTTGWHLIFPAIACGFGHALLFPSVVSLGTEVFPRPFRGSGTTIILGFTEVGAMLSARPLGWLIDNVSFDAMFFSAAGMAALIGLLYALTSTRRHDTDLAYSEDKVVLSEDKTADEEAEAVPFPQLGRNA